MHIYIYIYAYQYVSILCTNMSSMHTFSCDIRPGLKATMARSSMMGLACPTLLVDLDGEFQANPWKIPSGND